MKYYGDYLVGKTVICRFNTVDSTGAPAALTGIAVIVSKDGADVTPSGGVTPTASVGSVTGRNHVVIDMSVDPATFTAGSGYAVRLSGSAAVGAISVVGMYVGEWSVENRSVTVDANGRIQVQPGTATGQLDLSSGAIKIQNGLRKNVALAGFQFSMALSLNGLNPDHYTPATGKTVAATRSIDGGAFGACANAVVELANGDYKIDLAAADLNGTTIMLEFTASGCDTVRYNLVTSP